MPELALVSMPASAAPIGKTLAPRVNHRRGVSDNYRSFEFPCRFPRGLLLMFSPVSAAERAAATVAGEAEPIREDPMPHPRCLLRTRTWRLALGVLGLFWTCALILLLN